MTLEQIEHEFENDVFIDRQNSYDKSLIIPAIKAKWIGLYYREKRLLRNLEKKRSKFKHDSQVAIATNSKICFTPHEIDKLNVVAKLDILNLDNDINECKETVEMIKECMGAVLFIGNDLKNIVELRKLEDD